jgi:hypothetical protein
MIVQIKSVSCVFLCDHSWPAMAVMIHERNKRDKPQGREPHKPLRNEVNWFMRSAYFNRRVYKLRTQKNTPLLTFFPGTPQVFATIHLIET